MNRILLLFLSILIVSVGCDSTAAKERRYALSHFYGIFKGKGGIAISSWAGPDRESMIRSTKVVNDIGDEWAFWWDEIHLTDIGEHEFIIRYEEYFKNDKTNEILTCSTLYFFSLPFDAPIPLKKEKYIVDIKKSEMRKVWIHTLWNGDFDAVMENYKRKMK